MKRIYYVKVGMFKVFVPKFLYYDKLDERRFPDYPPKKTYIDYIRGHNSYVKAHATVHGTIK